MRANQPRMVGHSAMAAAAAESGTAATEDRSLRSLSSVIGDQRSCQLRPCGRESARAVGKGWAEAIGARAAIFSNNVFSDARRQHLSLVLSPSLITALQCRDTSASRTHNLKVAIAFASIERVQNGGNTCRQLPWRAMADTLAWWTAGCLPAKPWILDCTCRL